MLPEGQAILEAAASLTSLFVPKEQRDPRRSFSRKALKKLWRRELLKNGYVVCKYPPCGERIRHPADAVVDHIIPWAMGGRTRRENGQLLHIACDRMKGWLINRYVTKKLAGKPFSDDGWSKFKPPLADSP